MEKKNKVPGRTTFRKPETITFQRTLRGTASEDTMKLPLGCWLFSDTWLALGPGKRCSAENTPRPSRAVFKVSEIYLSVT